MKHVNENCPLPSEVSEQRQTSRVGSPEPASHGRWMLGICSVVSGTAPGELGARVLSLKQPVRAARWQQQQQQQRHRERSVVYVQTAQGHTEAVLFYHFVMFCFFFIQFSNIFKIKLYIWSVQPFLFDMQVSACFLLDRGILLKHVILIGSVCFVFLEALSKAQG